MRKQSTNSHFTPPKGDVPGMIPKVRQLFPPPIPPGYATGIRSWSRIIWVYPQNYKHVPST